MLKKFFILMLMCAAVFGAFSQKSTGQMPYSLRNMHIDFDKINTLQINPPDAEEYLQQEQRQINDSFVFPMRASALIVPVRKNFFDYAEKISFGAYDLYFLKIKSKYAKAINLYSDNFFIAEYCELYIYDSDYTKILGAFTSGNNKSNGKFACDYIYGDEIILEYLQPKNTHIQSQIDISEIGYFFRDVADKSTVKAGTGFGASSECEVNINCEEGNSFRKQQRGVVSMFIRFSATQGGFCSGTLINNTANDRTPYIITAAHCVAEYMKDYSYLSQAVFYFNYESAECENPVEEPSKTNTLTGCDTVVMERYADKAGSGLDVLLLRLDDDVPLSYNPYWVGWTAESIPPNEGAGIHHPLGDIKKISTFASTPTTMTLTYQSIIQTHWVIKFIQTLNGWGLTEEGSSGSCILNNDGKLFGIASGSMGNCKQDNSDAYSAYARFDLSYEIMKPYLDPLNTGVKQLDGLDCLNGLAGLDLQDDYCNIYPVPAKDKIMIDFSYKTDSNTDIVISDISGKIVKIYNIPAFSKSVNLDIQNISTGVYNILINDKKHSFTRKLIVK